MSTGTYGQQAIDTARDAHAFLLEGFGTFYVAALILTAVWCALWTSKHVKDSRDRRRRRKTAAARAKKTKHRGHVKAA